MFPSGLDGTKTWIVFVLLPVNHLKFRLSLYKVYVGSSGGTDSVGKFVRFSQFAKNLCPFPSFAPFVRSGSLWFHKTCSVEQVELMRSVPALALITFTSFFVCLWSSQETDQRILKVPTELKQPWANCELKIANGFLWQCMFTLDYQQTTSRTICMGSVQVLI